MTPLSELCRTLARADVARGDGDLDEARALYRHALVVVEATDEPWTAELTAQALFGLGMVALLERRAEEAHGFLTRSLAAEQARQDVSPQDAGRRHSAAVTAAWLGACERDDAGTHLAAAVTELAALVQADPASRVLVVGDLNTATTDPALTPLTARMADSREQVAGGFGFTWPAQFPLTRPDHVLARGLTPVSDQVLAAGGSDHRMVLVGLRVG